MLTHRQHSYSQTQLSNSHFFIQISDTSLAFLDIKLSIEGNGLCTSVHYKPTDLIVICCIHLHIHHMSRILFLILSFLDFVAFVVRTLIFP